MTAIQTKIIEAMRSGLKIKRYRGIGSRPPRCYMENDSRAFIRMDTVKSLETAGLVRYVKESMHGGYYELSN